MALLTFGLACTRTVALRFDPPAGVERYAGSTQPPADPGLTAGIGEVEIRPDTSTTLGFQTINLEWSGAAKGDLQGEWEKALQSRTYLGKVGPAGRGQDVKIDVSSTYTSRWSTSLGMSVLATFVGLACIGGGVGIGYAADKPSLTGTSTGLLVGDLVGTVVGSVVALAIPNRSHDQSWESKVVVRDRWDGLLYRETFADSDSYLTSSYTDTDSKHSGRASELYVRNIANALEKLDRKLPTVLQTYLAERDQRRADARADELLRAREGAPRSNGNVALPLANPRAPAERQLVAVMAMESPSQRLTQSEVQFLTDMLRKGASDTFDPGSYTIMSQAAMDILLPGSQIQCLAGKCLVEIGRTLQARYVIGGSLRDVGNGIGITIEAYDVRSGALVASETEIAAEIGAAVTLVRAMMPRVVARVVGSR